MKLNENYKDLIRLEEMEIPGTNGIIAEGCKRFAGKQVLAEIVWSDGGVEYQNHIFDRDGVLFYVGENDPSDEELDELGEDETIVVPSSEMTIIKDPSSNGEKIHLIVTTFDNEGDIRGVTKTYENGKIVHEECAQLEFTEDGPVKKYVYLKDKEYDDRGNEIASRTITGQNGQGYKEEFGYDDKNRVISASLIDIDEDGSETPHIYKHDRIDHIDGTSEEIISRNGDIVWRRHYDANGNCIKDLSDMEHLESEYKEFNGEWYQVLVKKFDVETGEVIGTTSAERNEKGYLTRLVSEGIGDIGLYFEDTTFETNELGDLMRWTYIDGLSATVNYIINEFVDEDVTLLN